MIGDKVTSDGIEFEVVWDGGEGLVGDRECKSTGFWEPPKRLYNKKSEYWTKSRKKNEIQIVNPLEDENADVLRDDRKDPIVELGNRSDE